MLLQLSSLRITVVTMAQPSGHGMLSGRERVYQILRYARDLGRRDSAPWGACRFNDCDRGDVGEIVSAVAVVVERR